MALWGSRIERLSGLQGDGTVTQPPLPQFNPLRLASGGVIDVPAPPAQLGRDQQAADVPLGPFVVTLSPITLANGGTIAGATGDIAQLSDFAAFVRWGRGGTKHEALIDWPVNGGTFTVAGDSLFVAAWVIVPLSGIFSAAFRNGGVPLSMGAWATPVRSAGSSGLLARRTMNIGTIAIGGTSGEVFVPPFARRVRYISNTNIVASGANTSLTFLYRRYGATFAQDILIQTTVRSVLDSTLAFDIPPQTQTMVLNNADPDTAQAGAALVFDLHLGG